MRGERGELVRVRGEGQSGEFGNLLGGAFGEFGVGVQAGADRCAADGQRVEAGQCSFDARIIAVEHADPTGDFLAEGDRSRVLQVGAANLDDVGELLGLLVEGGAEFLHSREELGLHFGRGGNVHRGGEGVVGRLGFVDVVIGVDGGLTAHLAARDFDGAVGNDFVGVHVGLRARTGLPDAQGEMFVELAGNDFVGGFTDQIALVGGELAEVLVDQRGGLFQDAKGADEFARHDVVADGEVDQGTGGLRAIITIIGHFDSAHAVGFCPGRSGRFRGGM